MKVRLFALLAVALPLCAASPSHADRLADLRATLEKLKGEAPIRAQIAARSTQKSDDEDGTGKDTQEVTVLAEQGPQGLRLTWSPQLLAEALKAARQRAANPDAPTRQGVNLSLIDAGQAAGLLDAAEFLLIDLDRAVLSEDKVEPRGGKPTRLLVIKPHDGLSTSDRKSLKSREDILKIWLDDSGFPVALDRVTKIKFSKMLISISIHSHRTRTFAVAGDHLVVMSSTEDSGGSGLGQSQENHNTTRVTLLP
jgi:hypothetical protein